VTFGLKKQFLIVNLSLTKQFERIFVMEREFKSVDNLQIIKRYRISKNFVQDL